MLGMFGFDLQDVEEGALLFISWSHNTQCTFFSVLMLLGLGHLDFNH